jgi:hypothetical protein
MTTIALFGLSSTASTASAQDAGEPLPQHPRTRRHTPTRSLKGWYGLYALEVALLSLMLMLPVSVETSPFLPDAPPQHDSVHLGIGVGLEGSPGSNPITWLGSSSSGANVSSSNYILTPPLLHPDPITERSRHRALA